MNVVQLNLAALHNGRVVMYEKQNECLADQSAASIQQESKIRNIGHQIDSANDRILKLTDRVGNQADRLHGDTPRPGKEKDKDGMPGELGAVFYSLEGLHSIIGMMEQEVERLLSGL